MSCRIAYRCLPILALWLWLGGEAVLQAQPLQRYAFSEPLMGTTFRVVVYAPSAAQAEAGVEAVWARMHELNQRLSNYIADSELMHLSATSGSGESIAVSDDLWTVLRAAEAVSRSTDGAFDVTIGPLTKPWRRAMRRQAWIDETAMAGLRQSVSHQYVSFDAEGQAVRLERPGMLLDLGGIAKGYAADEALCVLGNFGLPHALVDAGGDLRAGLAPPGAAGWSLTLSGADQVASPTTYRLADYAIASSGDRYQYLERDGLRYSHILDPRTGIGVTHHHQVTVVAPRGMLADAAASALSVLPLADARAWVLGQPNLEARIEHRTEGVLWTSPGFPVAAESSKSISSQP
ncbi:MAG: FAD:protein FMN transferase [Bacteroidota bacterium]